MASKQTEDARQRKLDIARRLVEVAVNSDPDQQRDVEIAIHLMRLCSVAQFKRAVAAYNEDHGRFQRKSKGQVA